MDRRLSARDKEGAEQTGTPRAELLNLEAARKQRRRHEEGRIMQSVLDCSGEVGYRRVSVTDICRRYGGSRSNFYRHFDNKEHCFTSAYENEGERLVKWMESFVSSGKPECLLEALEGLSQFLVVEPLRARALLVEVHVVAGASLCKRQELIERLALTLDAAYGEGELQQEAPPIRGEFVVNVIDRAAARALQSGKAEDFGAEAPALARLARRLYGRPDEEPT